MPKISKHVNTIRGLKAERLFEFEVMYNQTYNFYVKIPREFDALISLFSKDENDALNVRAFYTGLADYSGVAAQGYVIFSHTESGAIERFKSVIRKVLDMTSSTRKVIAILFEDRSEYSSNWGQTTRQVIATGCWLRLRYLLETTSGTTKQYHEYNKVTEVKGTLVNDYKLKGAQVLEHTELNEERLEALNLALQNLVTKLTEVTSSEENLTKMITSNVLLLK